MAKLIYSISSVDDEENVIDTATGEIPVTPEIIGEFGTKLVGHFDLDLKVDFVGGRPKNRPSPSA
jgi:hypothetical protein